MERFGVFKIKKQIRNVSRLGQIATTLARHGFGSLVEELGLEAVLPHEIIRKIRRAAEATISTEPKGVHIRFRQALEELGPTFVKLGQLLSVREDLLPKAFVTELKKLHAHVEAISFDEIRNALNLELGPALMERFSYIEPRPLAAGSIGQVHLARLKSGETIVLKIQRPNISAQMSTDLDLMEIIAGLIDKHIAEFRVFRPSQVVYEFKRSTLGELDFIREAASTTRIANNFKDEPNIVCPEVYWEFTCAKVLALAYLDGVPVSDRLFLQDCGLDPKLILDRAVSAFLQMVFVDGFFHGDLHPGNILALPNNCVGFVDFGITVKLSDSARRHLAGLLVCLLDENFDGVARHFMELSEPSVQFDHIAFTAEISNLLAPYLGLTIKDLRSGKLLWNLASISARYGAPLPTELALFLRTLASLEGVATELDPSFDIVKSCEQFTSHLVAELYSPEMLKKDGLAIAFDLAYLMRYAPLQIRRLLKYALDGQLKLQIDSESFTIMTRSLDRASARLSLSLIATGLILGSSILAQSQHLGPYDTYVVALIGYAAAGVLGLVLLLSILRRH